MIENIIPKGLFSEEQDIKWANQAGSNYGRNSHSNTIVFSEYI